MAEDLKKKVDELNEEQLDEVAGGDVYRNPPTPKKKEVYIF